MDKKLTFKALFDRDLDRLFREISAYKKEENLWIVKGDITNSGGNLALHLVGNLMHFVSHTLGKSSYKRNRPAEFNDKNVSREEILKSITETKESIHAYFNRMDESSLDQNYPLEVFGYPMTVHYFITHLSGHLMYHTGQINYHRRLVDQ